VNEIEAWLVFFFIPVPWMLSAKLCVDRPSNVIRLMLINRFNGQPNRKNSTLHSLVMIKPTAKLSMHPHVRQAVAACFQKFTVTLSRYYNGSNSYQVQQATCKIRL
jgi:hypothetical protein